MDRRILHPVQITNAEIKSRNLPFKKDELVINVDTGEIRVGGGYWSQLKSYKGDADVTLSVRVATTANVTIATDLLADATLDDVKLEAGDLVLVKNQSTASQNGLYVVAAPPARHAAYASIEAMANILVQVKEGTANAGLLYLSTGEATGTIDATAVAFAQVVQGGLRFAGKGQLAALPSKTAYASTDMVLIEQADGTLRKMAMSDLKTNMA